LRDSRSCAREGHGSQALYEIQDEYRIAVPFSEDAHDIGGADVAAADFSNVDSCQPTSQIAKGDRTQQVTCDERKDE
jgi:hypothetical protein